MERSTEEPPRDRATRRVSRHLRLLAELERSRRSLEAARSEISRAAVHSSSLVERLNEREELSRAILDGIDLGIVTADAAGVVTFVNRTAKAILKEPRGERVEELLALSADPDRLLGEESTLFLNYPFKTAAGEEVELELSVSRASSVGHAQIGFYFIFSDTREKKKRSLERERLERLAAMGTMVAGFAHEVRNPVAALRSLTESLAEELADAQMALPHVSRMLKMLERIERLVRTSLQFGRPVPPRRERCRPHAIIAMAIGSLVPRTIGQGEEIRVELEPDLPDVFVDETQLVQVLVVLLNNAFDSVGAARRVLITAREARAVLPQRREPERMTRDSQLSLPSPVVRFEVHDDGAGIADAIIGQIFDPFFTTKPAGTGLGLSIAQQIVSENGGTIEVSSQPGGTTFAVLIPAGPKQRSRL